MTPAVVITVSLDNGSFTLSGQDTTFATKIPAGAGSFTLTGQDIIYIDGVIPTGVEASCTTGGAVAYGEIFPTQTTTWQLVA